MNTLTIEQAKSLYNTIPFGLSVITKYSNGKIIAKFTHGSDTKTTVKVSYDYSLNTGENHLLAALVCLEKVETEHKKSFGVVGMSYNEKDDGYSFLTQRTI